MIEIKDEILNGEPKYRISDENGNILFDNLRIEQITPIIQGGTPLNKALFENLQKDIYDVIDKKTTFLLGEVEALNDCQQLEIKNLNVKKNEELFIVFRTRNSLVGGGDSSGYSLKINDVEVFSTSSYFLDCVAFCRLVNQSDQNYITANTISGSTTSYKSVLSDENQINSVSITGVRTNEIRKGNSLLIFKRTL